MIRRKRFKPRNVNLEPTRLEDGTIVYTGDSLTTVPCPKSIKKRMRMNLFSVARRSQVISPNLQRIAQGLIVEMGLKRKM